MKIEVIIAARGELPWNLQRTVESIGPGAGVTIVLDGAEPGNQVPNGIKARVVRPWQRPRGCGQCRHYGIMESRADIVVMVDGHMTFPAGWLDVVERYHRRKAKLLTCTAMQSLHQDGTPMDSMIEGGGWIAYRTREVWDNHWAMVCKWNAKAVKSGETGCVLGACYAMRREWYKAIGEPLSILEAWGGDEELLSLGTWFCGGRVAVLPIVTGHIHAAQWTGRTDVADQTDMIWSNRRAVLDVLPVSDEERAGLHEWINRTKRIAARRVPVTAERAERMAKVKRTWSAGERTMADLKAKGIVREPTEEEQRAYLRAAGKAAIADTQRKYTPPPAPAKDVAQVIVRPQEVCRMCGAVNSFKKISGPRKWDTFQQSYARCCRCGHKAQIRE